MHKELTTERLEEFFAFLRKKADENEAKNARDRKEREDNKIRKQKLWYLKD